MHESPGNQILPVLLELGGVNIVAAYVNAYGIYFFEIQTKVLRILLRKCIAQQLAAINSCSLKVDADRLFLRVDGVK